MKFIGLYNGTYSDDCNIGPCNTKKKKLLNFKKADNSYEWHCENGPVLHEAEIYQKAILTSNHSF